MLCGILHAVVDFSSALESEVQEDAFSSMYTKSWMIFFLISRFCFKYCSFVQILTYKIDVLIALI